jgi:hypothetical protein
MDSICQCCSCQCPWLFKIFPSICSFFRPDLPSADFDDFVTSDDVPTPIENRGGGIILTHGIFPDENPGKITGRINGNISITIPFW